MKKIILLLLFATLGWQQAGAQSFVFDGLVYNVTSPSTVEVGFQNYSITGEVIIPEEVTDNGAVYSVTSIGVEAFYSCTGMTSISIPNSVTNLGDLSFGSCLGLTTVTIPNSVTGMGINTFFNCTGLTSVTISNSVTVIGSYAFNGCTGLTSITIPSSVSVIGYGAFASCSGLTSVICNATTPINIDYTVFFEVNQSACSLTVPAESVLLYQETIYWQFFNPIVAACSTVNTTTISACGSYTWSNNDQTYTTSGIYTGTTTDCVTEKLDLTISNPTSFSSGGVNYVVISPNTVAVGDNAGAVGAIDIPEYVTTDCGTYSVIGINDFAFAYCSELTSVTIPNSVTSIGNYTFYDCRSLASVNIPDSVTIIGESTFSYCISLTAVIIPNSIASIGNGAFRQCSSLTSITIPSSVTSIGSYAFHACSGLTSVVIPNSITVINYGTFYACSGLTSVIIPNSVTSIGGISFGGCRRLTSVTCNVTTPLSIPADAFVRVNQGACSLTVPAGRVAAYQAAAVWQNFAPIMCANQVTNTFAQVAPICIGASLAALPTTSNEGIAGTWSPALNNQATTIYTFTANAGVCATTATMAITVNNTPALASQSYFVGRGIQLSSVPGYGTSYKVFDTANAANIIPASTVLTNGTYYASQTQNGCESTRSMLTVIVYSLTSVYSPACGSRLNTLATAISATAVPTATNYLFEVTGNGSTRTYYSPTNSFNFTQLQGTTAYDTSYSIRVAAGFNGQYGDFGSACSITTPAVAITTQITSSMCGTTLATMTTTLYCSQITGAETYRFEFTRGGASRTLESASNSVQINNISGGAAYNTTYSVRVAIKIEGIWQAYGTACTIMTPVASTQIRTNQCSTTLANKWAILYCSEITGATAYRFEWSNGGSTLVYTSSASRMQLGNYTGWALNTTYSVRVAVQDGGTWQSYGSACNVKTPASMARGISEDETALTIKAVPNPFETEYVLMAQGGNETPVQVSVYDMLGKQVEQFSVEANELENRSLGTNYTSGIYNVMISQGDDQQVVRIVKK